MNASTPDPVLPQWQRLLLISPILLLTALSLLAYAWSNQQSLDIDELGFLKRTNDNQLAINFGQKILVVDESQEHIELIDVEKHGYSMHGDFHFFSNGDLLIYHGAPELSLFEGLFRFMRFKQPEAAPRGSEEGFYRCTRADFSCQRFAQSMPALQTSFGLAMDWSRNITYVSNTPGFSLYAFDEQGEMISMRSDDLKFPNQILFADDRLWVADTNHHRIVEMSLDEGTFTGVSSTKIARFDHEHRWPTNIAILGNEHWVTIADSSMRFARIKRLSENGDAEVHLPADADLLGMVHWNDRVWVSDLNHQAIYSIHPSGVGYEALNLPRLNEWRDHELSVRSYYERLSQFCLLLLGICLVCGFLVAIKLESR